MLLKTIACTFVVSKVISNSDEILGIEEQQDRGGPGPRPVWRGGRARRDVLSLQSDQWIPVQSRQRTLQPGIPPALATVSSQIRQCDMRHIIPVIR